MKWCFLIHSAPFITEFLAKLAKEIKKEGNDCFFVFITKITEYSKRKYLPEDMRVLSKVDWCLENYQGNKKEFENLFWKGFFPIFDKFGFHHFVFDFKKAVEMINQEYQFFRYILEKEKPDVIIGESPVSVLFSEMFSNYRNSTTFLGIIGSKFHQKIDIYDLDNTCSKYQKTFQEMSSISDKERKFAKDFIEKFISHQEKPPYMEEQDKISRQSEFKRFKNYLKAEKENLLPWLKYILKRKKFKFFDSNSEFLLRYTLWSHPRHSLMRRIRILFSLLCESKTSPSLKEDDKFFLFPLHLQPELSSSFQATYFCDQINTAKNIAFSLPFPYKLYVKKHPSAAGEVSRDFYRKLKEIPNLVLIPSWESTEKLIKNSKGVIVLTSTVGMEAALAGKPVYVLGDVFYSYHPACRKIKSFQELKERINQDLTERPEIKNLEEINIRFILSYFKNTISGSVPLALLQNDTNDYKKIYHEIKRIFFNGKEN